MSENVGLCVEHICKIFPVSTVLGEKASDVEQSRGASAKTPGRRPPPLWTGGGQLNEGVTFSELTVLLFVFGVILFFIFEECAWLDGNGCVSECLQNAIFVCRLGPWRKMSRA